MGRRSRSERPRVVLAGLTPYELQAARCKLPRCKAWELSSRVFRAVVGGQCGRVTARENLVRWTTEREAFWRVHVV